MLHEYAVEPAVISNFDRVRFCLQSFGVHEARLLSRYPKKWERMVLDALPSGCGSIERKRIEEGLVLMKPRMVSALRQYDSSLDWVSNAMREQNSSPFQAVIVNQDKGGTPGVLEYDSIGQPSKLWDVDSTRIVTKTPAAMAEAIAPLLRIAQEIVIVDGYFKPDLKRYQTMVQRFWEAALDGRGGLFLTRFALHSCVKRGWEEPVDPERFFKACLEHLPPLVPPGHRMKVVLWDERDEGDVFHNRYVLTDRGGILIGKGLDTGKASQTDDFSLLSEEHARRRFTQFPDIKDPDATDGTPILTTFTYRGQITILGVHDIE
jgi:hypothetical protein